MQLEPNVGPAPMVDDRAPVGAGFHWRDGLYDRLFTLKRSGSPPTAKALVPAYFQYLTEGPGVLSVGQAQIETCATVKV
jgi:hypothetical protein